MMKRFLFILLICLACFGIKAQTNDAGLWTGLGIEKKITQTLSINFENSIRLNENYGKVGIILHDLRISYNVSNSIRVAANYRFSKKKRIDDFYNSRHRYYFTMSFKQKMGALDLTYRTRFQSQYTSFYSSETGIIPENLFRNKLTIAYSTGKPYKPFIATEMFYQLNNPIANEFSKVRYVGGIDYTLNKMNRIRFFYLFQKEINAINPLSLYVAGIDYQYTF
ncbi:MAG: DUF2490 domain-containing protein [Bacteroidia bacterium]|nr:DUF2490 domain-containing protein [Bacteroidia bacterium]